MVVYIGQDLVTVVARETFLRMKMVFVFEIVSVVEVCIRLAT
jgi:hypothetical protein